MTDTTPFLALAESLVNLIEVVEKTSKLLPAHERASAEKACARARTARMQLNIWLDEVREDTRTSAG